MGLLDQQDFAQRASDLTTDAEGTDVLPLLELTSTVAGRDVRVRLWRDRIDWVPARRRKKGRSGAGPDDGDEAAGTIPIIEITEVSTRQIGITYFAVDVHTAHGVATKTESFPMLRDEAVAFRNALLSRLHEVGVGETF